MTKYILHGGYTRIDNESNRTFFGEFTKDVMDGSTILMCFFAAGEEDKTETYKELVARCNLSTDKTFNFQIGTRDGFLEQLVEAEAVYIHGGNTDVLLEVLNAYGDVTHLFRDKTVAGSSAGAYILAKYGTAHSVDYCREGYGLVPIRLVCHYESLSMPPTPASYALLQQKAPELPILYLRDCEWKVYLL